mgnify:CR=1 FL=1
MVRTNQNYFILESVASLAMTVSKSDEYYIHKLGSVTEFGKLKEKMRNDPLLSLRRFQFRGSIRNLRKVGVFVQYKDKVCRL